VFKIVDFCWVFNNILLTNKNVDKRHSGNNNDLSPIEYKKRYFERTKSLKKTRGSPVSLLKV
jgi:hypothetical protein